MAPEKRRRDDANLVGSPETKKAKASAAPEPTTLPKQEVPFPRGGGGVLTPLEHRQIQNQAKRDVLFEEHTGKKAPKHDFEDEENDIADDAVSTTKAVRPAKRAKKVLSEKRRSANSDSAQVHIEPLSYKRLVPGSIVLGQVAQINSNDIAINLPNNLSGFVPITSISDAVTQKIHDAVEGDPHDRNESETDAGGENVPLDMGEMFSIGQYLRAHIISTQEEHTPTGKSRRHIEVSIKPQQANHGLVASDCIENTMIQASVVSIEDHGLVMDLGLRDKSVQGFMSTKDLGTDMEISSIKHGSVYLCLIIERSPNGRTVKLSLDQKRISNVKKGAYVTDTPTVESILPGTAIDVLVTDSKEYGTVGKFMGLLDVTADLIHSGKADGHGKEKGGTVGSKVRGRVICTFPASDGKKLGFSLLDHIVYWRAKTIESSSRDEKNFPTAVLSASAIVPSARVVRVEEKTGLFVDVGVPGVQGFVHISKVSDGKIETLSESHGSYKVGSVHEARVLGYNHMDGLFILSLERSVIEQPFLRMEDVKIGQLVKAKFEKLIIDAEGVVGAVVELAKGVTGLIPEMHFADVKLQYPERKFKEGTTVTARVLSLDLVKRQIRLTMKKSLVNSDAELWRNYDQLVPGMQSPGTLISVLPNGAVVQFYGSVRGFLPVAEMSETFIRDPKQHFKKGQVVNVHILSVDAESERLTVSCRDQTTSGTAQQEAIDSLKLGQKLSGKIIEKTDNEAVVEVEPHSIRARLPFEHLTDGSSQKTASAAKRLRVGQELSNIIVLHKHSSKRLVGLSSKPSLVKAASEGKLLTSVEDLVQGAEVSGYVNNITPSSVFIRFGGSFTGLLLKRHLPDEDQKLPDYGFRKDQSVTARIMSIDQNQGKFLLTRRQPDNQFGGDRERNDQEAEKPHERLSNPVDGLTISVKEFTLGKVTQAKIVSVKETQLNVLLADGVQGRIDVSEIFDDWNDMKDRKHPLKQFHPKQVIPVRILGRHDSRNHRFLPISHRQGRVPVLELTTKPSNLKSAELDILTLEKLQVGSSHLVFVNSVKEGCIWVNISPNVRGRIRSMDVSDDISLLKDVSINFPPGSCLRAKITDIDAANNRLDLTARSDNLPKSVDFDDLSEGMILPGRVTKVMERQIMIQLSEHVSGSLHLIDMADDFSTADHSGYQKNQTVRVCIKEIDAPSKRITFSTRPSRIFSSSLPVRDPDITSISQLKVNDIIRGFIKNITDKGLFVSLSGSITAFVRVPDLSDGFIKDWQPQYELDKLVEGRILAVDLGSNRIRMSLKKSHLDDNYQPLLAFSDVKVGQIVTGKIRKVEDFGVFVVVDKSNNVSGLCHRTKMADRPNADPKALYEEGDVVKAKVLSIDTTRRRISFGLKTSYFLTEGEIDSDEAMERDIDAESDAAKDDSSDAEGGVDIAAVEDPMEEDNLSVFGDIDIEDVEGSGTDSIVQPMHSSPQPPFDKRNGLDAGGFDWTGSMARPTLGDQDTIDPSSDSEVSQNRRKKHKRPSIKEDRTGNLDAFGPQVPADFERLLLGQPNSSVLWLQYMAFHLEVSEIETARSVAERALKTIHIRETEEKLNVWIALLNLENTYGSPASLDSVFARACQFNDPQEIHERLTSIYIQSGKYHQADELFLAALKKFSTSPALYLNFATFLFTHPTDIPSGPDRARALLPRAMQALPAYEHVGLTSKFAQLEFKHGDPERGRTVFENLVAQWPKRFDLWNVLLDMEIGLLKSSPSNAITDTSTEHTLEADGKKRKKKSSTVSTATNSNTATNDADKAITRRLFERLMSSSTGSKPSQGASKEGITAGPKSLKPKQAKFFFKKWLDFEEKFGGQRDVERVKALAAEYVRGLSEGD